MISSLFVHLFFIVFAILIFALMGKLPPVQIIQIGYYTFAVICLVVVLSYLTCSITPFFRDFGQIINVILNVGMWATPILWDTTTIPNIPNWLNSLLKLNPLYYIVQGYRTLVLRASMAHPLLLGFCAYGRTNQFQSVQAPPGSFLRCIIGGWNEHRKYRNSNFN